MPDSVAMEICVAERDADKLEDWADEGPDDIGNGIVQLSQSEVPWGRTSDIVALKIPFYGAHDSHYSGINQTVFACDGETYAEAPTVSYETGDPALTLDADGALHGMPEAFEYWQVRKRAEEKMRAAQEEAPVQS
jgi:hypothetical protein